MNWLGGDALSFSHRFHHWLMLYTLGQYIVNVQSSTTGDGFLTIFIFGICREKCVVRVSVRVRVRVRGKCMVENDKWTGASMCNSYTLQYFHIYRICFNYFCVKLLTLSGSKNSFPHCWGKIQRRPPPVLLTRKWNACVVRGFSWLEALQEITILVMKFEWVCTIFWVFDNSTGVSLWTVVWLLKIGIVFRPVIFVVFCFILDCICHDIV